MSKIISKTTDAHWLLKAILLIILFSLSFGAIIFSLVVLFTDIGKEQDVTLAQARGMFTAFINRDINEVHPRKPVLGGTWGVNNVEFRNKNLAVVTAEDGHIQTTLEFIYVIEGLSKIRILTVNDITDRDIEDAHLTLIRYLTALRDDQYEAAALYYDGSVSRLAPYGTLGASEESLLAGYCRVVSPTKKCMRFTISDPRSVESNTYRFNVTYINEDDSIANINGRDLFSALVARRGIDDYVVLSLPFD